MHGDVAFAALLCSAHGLEPTVEAKGFSRIKAKEKENGSKFYQAVWTI